MTNYKERLTANAEDFDSIVSEMLAENERLREEVEKHKAVTKALAEWSKKYPSSMIMSISIKDECEDRLHEIELMAITLQEPKKEILHCQSDRNGECTHENCPQLKDGEPKKSGRHCPLDDYEDC